MNKCTIRFIYKDQSARTDDVIYVYEDSDYDEMYRIVFRPGDFKKTANEFYLDRARTIEYVSSILKVLPYDADGFSYVQVDSAIQPTVLYSVYDMLDRQVRYLLEDTIDAALRRPVEKIKVKPTA
jgi:hypothetical protein